MMLATMHDAIPFIGITVLALIVASAPGALGWLILGGDFAQLRMTRRARIVTGVLIGVASVPLYAVAAFIGLIAYAALGCPPYAYECPL
jgi:hypothetical protein